MKTFYHKCRENIKNSLGMIDAIKSSLSFAVLDQKWQ